MNYTIKELREQMAAHAEKVHVQGKCKCCDNLTRYIRLQDELRRKIKETNTN